MFFSLKKKNQKDFYVAVAVLSGSARENVKVFCFFSSEKKAFLTIGPKCPPKKRR